MSKVAKIKGLAIVIFIGFMISCLWAWFCGNILHLGYPFNTFLAPLSCAFSDFTDLMPLISDLNIYNRPNDWLNYFPFAYLILYPFSLIKPHGLGYLLLVLIFCIFYLRLNTKFLYCEELSKFKNFVNIFIISCLSYPFLFILNRGNTDMLIFLIFAAFISFLKKAYENDDEIGVKNKNFLASSILLTILCAIKPYFIVFLLLFLKQKRIKEILICCLGAVLLNFMAFAVFKGGIIEQLEIFLQNLNAVKFNYVESNTHYGMGFSSSILGALKGLLYFILNAVDLKTIAIIYNFLIAILSIVIIYATIKEKIFWKQITLLSLYAYSAPFMVYDYKLLFFLFPIWLFINEKENTRLDKVYTILFGLLLISKSYCIWNLSDGFNFISLNMFLNPFLMMIFIACIMSEQKIKQF